MVPFLVEGGRELVQVETVAQGAHQRGSVAGRRDPGADGARPHRAGGGAGDREPPGARAAGPAGPGGGGAAGQGEPAA